MAGQKPEKQCRANVEKTMPGESWKNMAGQKLKKQGRAEAEKTSAGALGPWPWAMGPAPWPRAPVLVFSASARPCFCSFCPAMFFQLSPGIVFSTFAGIVFPDFCLPCFFQLSAPIILIVLSYFQPLVFSASLYNCHVDILRFASNLRRNLF